MALSPRVSLTGSPLKLNSASRPIELRGLELRLAAIPEPRSHSEKVLPSVGAFYRSPQPEEGMVLNGTLPQMFAGLFVDQSEHKRVFLLAPTLVVLLHDD